MHNIDHAPPDRRLQAFVRGYIQRRTPSPPAAVTVEPYVARLGGMLDFLFADLYDICVPGMGFIPCFAAAVVGPHTHGRIQLRIRGRVEEFVILLHPQGIHQLFGEPAHLFVNTGYEAQAVLGPEIRQLHQRLGNAVDFRERTRLADAFLLGQLRDAERTDRSSKAFDAIVAADCPLTVAEAARQAGLSVRQLERKCLQYTGLSPKMLGRISRFERAMALRRASGAQWTTIAHELEYSDQMHMIRDFRSLAGDTPGRIMQRISADHLISVP
ncbi:MAG TPA: AraC family transcriptional regulator [Bryobacteraceae bacterium]|jgi:AraC-like DNA-binding protein